MSTVKMKDTVYGSVKIYEAGQIYDVTDYQAVRWQKAGICEPIDAPTVKVNTNVSVNGQPVEVMVEDNETVEMVEKPKRRKRRSKEG